MLVVATCRPFPGVHGPASHERSGWNPQLRATPTFADRMFSTGRANLRRGLGTSAQTVHPVIRCRLDAPHTLWARGVSKRRQIWQN